MMKKILPLALLLTAASTVTSATAAEAQCRGAWFCADVNVGVGVGVQAGAHVQIGPRVIRRPARRVVVVHTPPPPPAPRVVVIHRPVAPPPPAVVTVQAAPQPVQPAPVVVHERPAPSRTNGRVGLHGRIGSTLSDSVQMGGVGGALRLRPNPHFAVDLGTGIYAGTDANDQDRVEIPVTVDGLYFINPQNALQAYLLAGVGVSTARTEGMNPNTGNMDERHMVHVGAQAGAGLEWRVSRNLALNADVRGFIRQRVNQDERPEFINAETGQETDTSAGAMATLGATLYFN